MYSSIQLALKYLEYFFTAKNGKGHGMHSPFVFELITTVLNDKKKYPAYEIAEQLRKQLLKDNTLLQIDDYGAGSAVSNVAQRTVASIAASAAKNKKFGQLLFRMVQYYKPATIIELGTSLGITTHYLSLANPASEIITLEGAAAIAAKANENFKSSGLKNVELVKGNFDETLSPVLDTLPAADFVFIDGNHRKEPTLKYFKQLFSKVNNETILVFDDIHWSREMEEAWDEIKKHPEITCTADLFFIGLAFFRKEIKEKQHFKIRF